MKYVRSMVWALVLLIPTAGMSLAQDDADQERSQADDERDMDATQCVSIDRIREIDIVDSRTLVFRMSGNKVYRNDLPYQCSGLKRNDTLMYRSSAGELCNVDIVTVLNDHGFGFWPGASCGLGMFHPITGEIADELLQAGD